MLPIGKSTPADTDNDDTLLNKWYPYPRYLLRKYLINKYLASQKLSGKNCLEIGYGAGDMLLLFASYALTVTGYDFSDMAYKEAMRRINKRIDFADRINLIKIKEELQNRKYDYIFAFEVLEHIEDDVMAIREWTDMLKTDGQLIISVPAHKKKWGNIDRATGHYRRYERLELKELVCKANLKLSNIWCYGYPMTILLDPILNATYSPKNNSDICSLDREYLTKQSGTKRYKSGLAKYVSNVWSLYPFCLLQQLFLSKELGSAYIVIARNVK